MKKIAKWLYKKLFDVDWMILEWQFEHQEKLAQLTNTLEHIALKKLGYRVKSNLQAKYYVEGQLPDAPLKSLYSLEKIDSTPPAMEGRKK